MAEPVAYKSWTIGDADRGLVFEADEHGLKVTLWDEFGHGDHVRFAMEPRRYSKSDLLWGAGFYEFAEDVQAQRRFFDDDTIRNVCESMRWLITAGVTPAMRPLLFEYATAGMDRENLRDWGEFLERQLAGAQVSVRRVKTFRANGFEPDARRWLETLIVGLTHRARPEPFQFPSVVEHAAGLYAAGWAATDAAFLMQGVVAVADEPVDDVPVGERVTGWLDVPVERAMLGVRAGLSPVEVATATDGEMRLLAALRAHTFNLA